MNYKILLLIPIMLLTVFGCNNIEPIDKIDNLAVSSDSDQISDDNFIRTFPIKVLLRWRGGGNPSCDQGGDCGICSGFCVLINFLQYSGTLGSDLITAGWSGVELTFSNGNTKMTMKCLNNTADNGDGYCEILDDFYMTTAVANELGFNSVLIKEGRYLVNYTGSTYGKVKFDVVTT